MNIGNESLILVESHHQPYGIDRYLVNGRIARDLIFDRASHGAQVRHDDDSITVTPSDISRIRYTHAKESDLRYAPEAVIKLAALLREANGIDDNVLDLATASLAMRIMYDSLSWLDAVSTLYELEEIESSDNL